MPFAALIDLNCAGHWPDIFGRSLLEYQVQRLASAGVTHFIFIAGDTPETPVPIAPRAYPGLSIDLVKTGEEAAHVIHPSETVILADPRILLSAAQLERLTDGQTPLLLTVENEPVNQGFELLDAASRWVGWGRVAGEEVWRIGSRLGDWDLASTLVRSALQAGAWCERLRPGEFATLHDQAAVTSYARTLVQEVEAPGTEDRVGHCIAKRLAPFAIDRKLDGRALALGGTTIVTAATVAAAFGWLAVAVLALVVGTWLSLTGERLLIAAHRHLKLLVLLPVLRAAIGLLAIALIAFALWRASGQWGVFLLAALVSTAMFIDRRTARSGYRFDVTTVAVLFGIPAAIGFPVAGLACAAATAAVGLALEYRSLRGRRQRWSTGT